MKEEQGKKLDPNDPAIPAEPDKPAALADEDLDRVAGGGLINGATVRVYELTTAKQAVVNNTAKP